MFGKCRCLCHLIGPGEWPAPNSERRKNKTDKSFSSIGCAKLSVITTDLNYILPRSFVFVFKICNRRVKKKYLAVTV